MHVCMHGGKEALLRNVYNVIIITELEHLRKEIIINFLYIAMPGTGLCAVGLLALMYCW